MNGTPDEWKDMRKFWTVEDAPRTCFVESGGPKIAVT